MGISLRYRITVLSLMLASTTAVRANSITTTFVSNNSQSGNMFDVDTNGSALNVTAFDLNLATGTWGVEVYAKSGTWVGFESNAAAWSLIGSGTLIGQGAGNATRFDVPDFTLAPNATMGLYITTTAQGGIMNYTNGTAVGTVAASNANLTILQGAGVQYKFSSTFTPRIWNGTIYYDVAQTQAAPSAPLPSVAKSGFALVGLLVFARRRKPATA